MNDQDIHDAVSVKSAAVGTNGSQTAGALIRSAREAQGLQIDMLAVTLKVPAKKLEALEADRLEELPDMVFVRALAASVCRALKMEDAAVLSALPPSSKPQIKTDESGLNTVFEYADGSWLATVLTQFKKPQGIAITVILVGILVVFFAPLGSSKQDVSDESAKLVFPPVAVASAVADSLSSSESAVSNGFAVGALPSSSATLENVRPDPAGSNLSVVSELQSISPVATVSLNATGPSWVEVVDATGAIQIRRTLMQNETVSLSGRPPLKVTLGRADLVVAYAKGQPIDLSVVSKDNVARFEVNQ